MTDGDALLSAYILDGHGAGRPSDWDGIHQWQPDQGTLWVHLDRTHDQSRQWLTQQAGLDPIVCDALLAEDTRPRSTVIGEGALVILRGVNLNPGAEPDDMISIRLWLDATRIISLRYPRLMAAQDLRDRLARGDGPRSSATFLVQLAETLTERMAPVMGNVDELIDQLEEQVISAQTQEVRSQLRGLRGQVITLRRHIAPQRDAIWHLYREPLHWLTDRDRAALHEVGDRTTRYVEDLDAMRERASLIHEELASRLSERMNRTMYVLSMMASIFLPLGLLTGLLGINVAGIPGAETPWAFAVVCLSLVVLAAVQWIVFRRLKLW